tara:strand:- start:12593 stop:13456 length:864 start_codon:yes stop_codon:yes gene_type:complete
MGQMKKVVVLGCKGMAGHVVKAYLEITSNYDVWGIARGVEPEENLINLDVSNTKELKNIFTNANFDVVINCIGLLNKTAEDNPELAVWFNSYFPQLLASYGRKYNFKLVHISTDCVFSGKEGGYTEDSFKNGIGFYAQSKALGEVVNTKDLTFRTSIIGPELKQNGIGLFHWFMNQEDSIKGFSKAIWSGVTTLELAKAIFWAIENDLTGLYHLTNNETINKYELLNLFKKYTKKYVKIIEVEGKKVNKSFIDTRKLIDYNIPNYETMIAEMFEFINKNQNAYIHYF